MMTRAAFAGVYREAHPAPATASAELRSTYGLAPFDAGGGPTLQLPANLPALTAARTMRGAGHGLWGLPTPDSAQE